MTDTKYRIMYSTPKGRRYLKFSDLGIDAKGPMDFVDLASAELILDSQLPESPSDDELTIILFIDTMGEELEAVVEFFYKLNSDSELGLVNAIDCDIEPPTHIGLAR